MDQQDCEDNVAARWLGTLGLAIPAVEQPGTMGERAVGQVGVHLTGRIHGFGLVLHQKPCLVFVHFSIQLLLDV